MKDKRTLRVALVANLLPPYRISLYNQINAHPDINLEVLLCSWKEKDRSWDVNTEEINFSCHTFRGLNIPLRFSPSRSDYYHIHLNTSLLARLAVEKYDTVIFSGYASLTHQAAFWLTKMKKIPGIIWYRSHASSNSLIRKLMSPYIDAMINGSKAVIVPGEKSKQHLLLRGADPRDIFSVGNSIDNDSFNQAYRSFQEKGQIALRKELNLADQKVILYVGRLVDVKGLFVLLDSFVQVKKKVPGSTLLILGDGYLQSKLMRYCQQHDISSVKFVGFVQPSELGKYYFSSDVFVLPSRYETWGLVLNEAMIFGLPVVTTSCVGAAGEIVLNKKTGFIVPPDNPEMLADALVTILSNEQLSKAMGENAQALIAKHKPEHSAPGFVKAIRHAAEQNNRQKK